MNDDLLKMQRLYEIKDALQFKKANQELYDLLIFTTEWLLRYCQKNGIRPPNIEHLYTKIQAVRDKVDAIYPDAPSDESYHPDDCGDDRRGVTKTLTWILVI